MLSSCSTSKKIYKLMNDMRSYSIDPFLPPTSNLPDAATTPFQNHRPGDESKVYSGGPSHFSVSGQIARGGLRIDAGHPTLERHPFAVDGGAPQLPG